MAVSWSPQLRETLVSPQLCSSKLRKCLWSDRRLPLPNEVNNIFCSVLSIAIPDSVILIFVDTRQTSKHLPFLSCRNILAGIPVARCAQVLELGPRALASGSGSEWKTWGSRGTWRRCAPAVVRMVRDVVLHKPAMYFLDLVLNFYLDDEVGCRRRGCVRDDLRARKRTVRRGRW